MLHPHQDGFTTVLLGNSGYYLFDRSVQSFILSYFVNFLSLFLQ